MNELPPGWSMAHIEDLFAPLEDGRTLHQGWSPRCEKTPSESEDTWGVLKTTAIQPGAFHPEHNKALPAHLEPRPLIEVRPGDLLVTCAGPRARCGVSCLVGATRPRLMMSGKMYRFRVPDQRIDPRFVAFYLQTPTAWAALDQMKTGGSDSGLNLTHARFRRLGIPVAPLPEQERIVAAIEAQFSRLDAGVAALEQARRKLTLVRAAVVSGLAHGPDGAEWPSVEMGEILARARYGTSTKCAFDGRGLPVLRIPNVQAGSISLEDLKYAIDPSVDLTGALATEGDVLIIRTNGSRSLIGRAALVPALPEPTAFASYLIQLRMNPGVATPAYVAAVLPSAKVRAQIEQLAATTAGQYNISLSKLRSLHIPLPPLPEQRRALGAMERRMSLVTQMELAVGRALAMSYRLRAAILSAAFTGNLAPQDATDEPGSALLDRIAAERALTSDPERTNARQRSRKVTA